MFETGSWLEVSGARLFVSTAGPDDALPILLLHGGLGSRNDFLPLSEALRPSARLLALDTRGHGRSTIGDLPLTYQRLEQDVVEVIRQIGCGPVGIIGHSDGGIAALRVAASGEVPLRFVVAGGAHWDLEQDDPTRGLYSSITSDEWREMFPDEVSGYEEENPEPDFERLFAAVRTMWLGSGSSDYPGESVRKIACPLLAVRGDDDFLVSLQNTVGLLERVKDAHLLNIPFTGHEVFQGGLDPLLPSLRTFLDHVGAG
ncbi:alpha/beta fold hydrolase [Roseibium sp.]|uniref:alpha/beta fold hydrolase n=1 Tax=Roseibium sp. TaxID=1936156 RepID=UPI003A96A02B